jgi:hypothetical protein
LTAAFARVRALGSRVPAVDVAAIPVWATVAGIAGLMLISLFIRTRVLGAGFWIDEGLSVGIAHHPLTSIPALLRQDGSPPLYCACIGSRVRDGERRRTPCRSSSPWLRPCLLGRPLDLRAAHGLDLRRLAAVDPYLTYYGQETRMYSLVAALSSSPRSYVHGVLGGRRRYLPCSASRSC